MENSEAEDFVHFVFSVSRISPRLYQPKTWARRIPACLRALRCGTLQEAREKLTRRPDLLGTAVDALLIGVTSFFRDRDVFERLEGNALPTMLASRARLRVCSIGCSSGQELYSVAMLLCDAGALERSFLLGIDCRRKAVCDAIQATYPEADWQNVSPARIKRYAERGRGDGKLTVAHRLRQAVRWSVCDLVEMREQQPWDIILFRNVAIYMEQAHLEGVWKQIHERLEPGGLLITGKAEVPSPALRLARESFCVYRKASAS